MKAKKVNDTLNEGFRDFAKYGEWNWSKNLIKDDGIFDYIVKGAYLFKDGVKLYPNGVEIKTTENLIKIDIKKNIIYLNTSPMFVSHRQIMDLYNKVLEASFKDEMNEDFNALTALAVGYLSWLALRKIVKFVKYFANEVKTVKAFDDAIDELLKFKIFKSDQFDKEIKVMELNDRYQITIEDPEMSIHTIKVFKNSQEIMLNDDENLKVFLPKNAYMKLIILLDDNLISGMRSDIETHVGRKIRDIPDDDYNINLKYKK